MRTNTSAHRTPARSGPIRVSMFACVLLAFGLLLWARFILVTGHPRTAIAEPEAPAQAAQAAKALPADDEHTPTAR